MKEEAVVYGRAAQIEGGRLASQTFSNNQTGRTATYIETPYWRAKLPVSRHQYSKLKAQYPEAEKIVVGRGGGMRNPPVSEQSESRKTQNGDRYIDDIVVISLESSSLCLPRSRTDTGGLSQRYEGKGECAQLTKSDR